jgi:hypothetical protein
MGGCWWVYQKKKGAVDELLENQLDRRKQMGDGGGMGSCIPHSYSIIEDINFIPSKVGGSYKIHRTSSPRLALWGPLFYKFLQGIGSLSCGRGGLHEIWIIDSSFGEKKS